jgi:hypothetical protein
LAVLRGAHTQATVWSETTVLISATSRAATVSQVSTMRM